jgi:hypothetical protein
MPTEKEILFEILAPESKQVLIYAERILGQVRVHAIDKVQGDLDLGGIQDVWRELNDTKSELRVLRALLNLPDDADVSVAISRIKNKINELAGLVGKEES